VRHELLFLYPSNCGWPVGLRSDSLCICMTGCQRGAGTWKNSYQSISMVDVDVDGGMTAQEKAEPCWGREKMPARGHEHWTSIVLAKHFPTPTSTAPAAKSNFEPHLAPTYEKHSSIEWTQTSNELRWTEESRCYQLEA
jgi:hypothetical protein